MTSISTSCPLICVEPDRRSVGLPSSMSWTIHARVRSLGLVAAAIVLALPMVLFGSSGSPPGLRATPQPGRTPVSTNQVPEGRLVLQLTSGLEVLAAGASGPESLGGGPIDAYGVSPDGTEVVAATNESQPTGYTREDRLFTIDIGTGDRRRTLVRAAPNEDLGPASWSPDGSKAAYRLTVLPVDHAARRSRDTTQTICVVSRAASEKRCFSDLGAVDAFAWAPSGDRILVDGVGAHSPLRILDLRTGAVSPFVWPDDPGLDAALGDHPPQSFVSVGWSPSGDFVSTDVGAPAAFDRRGRFLMLGHATREFSDVHAWSPTEDLLAHATGRPPYAITHLYLMDPERGRDRLLFSTGHGRRAPIILDVAWSPSARWLAVATARRTLLGQQTVRIFDVARGNTTGVVHLGPQEMTDPLVGWTT